MKDCNQEATYRLLLQAYKSAKRRTELAQEEEEKCRNALIDFAEPLGGIEGHGFKIAEVERKGNIDYNRIPALSCINLEEYRKPSTSHWRIDEISKKSKKKTE